MKKNLLFAALTAITVFSACKKDDPDPVVPQTVTLRYDFTADVSGQFDFKYTADTSENFETLTTQSWSRTLTVTKANSASSDTATLTVFPPEAWIGTTIQTTATVSIFVNNVQKGTNTAIIGGFDRPVGLKASATY